MTVETKVKYDYQPDEFFPYSATSEIETNLFISGTSKKSFAEAKESLIRRIKNYYLKENTQIPAPENLKIDVKQRVEV